jgi:hypothetical protein
MDTVVVNTIDLCILLTYWNLRAVPQAMYSRSKVR